MNEIINLLPNTCRLLSKEQESFLDSIEKNTGPYKEGENPFPELVQSGKIFSFQIGENIYYYPKGTPVVTLIFKFPVIPGSQKIKTNEIILGEEEKIKISRLRRFISNFLHHKNKISDKTFAFYLQLYTFALPMILSIPEPLYSLFMEETKGVDLQGVKNITPKILKCRCNFCGHHFSTYIRHKSQTCPECKRMVLI